MLGAVEHYPTLSLMIIDGSITEMGEGPVPAASLDTVDKNHRNKSAGLSHARSDFFLDISRELRRSICSSSSLHSQGMASLSPEMWGGG